MVSTCIRVMSHRGHLPNQYQSSQLVGQNLFTTERVVVSQPEPMISKVKDQPLQET